MPAVSVLVFLVVLLTAGGTASASTPVPGVGCESRIEGPSGSPPAPATARDVIRGPLSLIGAAELRRGTWPTAASGAPRPGRPAQVRLGVRLAAGHTATLTIAPRDRSWAALQYRLGSPAAAGRPRDNTVAFTPCVPETPTFDRRASVGAVTVWGGGVLVRRRGCLTLRLTVDGVARDGVRLALGARCPAPAPPPVAAATCAHRSGASFPRGFDPGANLIAGPLSFIGMPGAAGAVRERTVRDLGWWKSPVIVRAGRVVTVRISKGSRDTARLIGYADGEDPGVFARQPVALRLTACGRGTPSGSDSDGDPVTFWSGGLRIRRVPACVHLEIAVQGERLARRAAVAFGIPAAPCAATRV